MNEITDIFATYNGSDGDRTKALYARLESCGPIGIVAMNLFRACKNSARAKVYRGGIQGKGSYRGMAYDRKQWAIDNLAKALERYAADLGIKWGWGIDDKQAVHCHVLYVDLPTGQVSFHTAPRGSGPDYAGKWDGIRGMAPQRIGVSKKASEQAVNAVAEAIASVVGGGADVRIAPLGTFKLKHRAERQGRNPATGEEIRIAASTAIVFKASKKG